MIKKKKSILIQNRVRFTTLKPQKYVFQSLFGRAQGILDYTYL